MHIVYVCNEYPPATAGGIGTAVAVLARAMVGLGHRVTVLGFCAEGREFENDQGVAVLRLRCRPVHRSIRWFWIRCKYWTALRNLHQQKPIDVIEWPDFDGLHLLPIQGVTELLKVHGGRISHRVHGFGPYFPIREFFELRMMRTIQNSVGVSSCVNNEWTSYSKAVTRAECVVYNPVNVNVFKPVPERDLNVIFYSGGLRKRKGVHTLAKAASI